MKYKGRLVNLTPESTFCGLDIGGVNTKIVVLRKTKDENLITEFAESYYFPFWEQKSKFPSFIKKLILEVDEKFSNTIYALTITAELSDTFKTKKEGIEFITNCVARVTKQTPLIFTTTGEFLSPSDAIINWNRVAASNWFASTCFIAKKIPDCLFLDIGSTTTDIIHIKNGTPKPKGKTDIDRLQTGELVYVGTLRTNLAALTNEILLDTVPTETSSEFFACMGDVLRVLELINSVDYTTPPPDGRSTSKNDCLARIARVICGDMNLLSEKKIVEIASQYFKIFIKRIQKGINQVLQNDPTSIPKAIVLTGIGAKIIGDHIVIPTRSELIFLSNKFSKKESDILPALAVATLLREWKQNEDY